MQERPPKFVRAYDPPTTITACNVESIIIMKTFVAATNRSRRINPLALRNSMRDQSLTQMVYLRCSILYRRTILLLVILLSTCEFTQGKKHLSINNVLQMMLI